MQTITLPVLADLLTLRPRGTRFLVAVAGAPASGKSRLSEELVERLEQRQPGRAAILPMDGYHYDDALLKQLGRHARKGAPDTFDVGGLCHMLQRLRENTGEAIAVPVFDRGIETARAGARLIPAAADIVVVEGNYLLLRRPPWSALKSFFDLTVMVVTPETILRQRLTKRWEFYGLPPSEISRKIEEVDLPNGRFVVQESAAAEYRIDNAVAV